MTLKDLPIGTRIYYGGDMANESHFGTITNVKTDRWGEHLEITPDADSERKPYWIDPCMFSAVYLGHGGTRFVTEDAWRTKRGAEMQAEYAKYAASRT